MHLVQIDFFFSENFLFRCSLSNEKITKRQTWYRHLKAQKKEKFDFDITQQFHIRSNFAQVSNQMHKFEGLPWQILAKYMCNMKIIKQKIVCFRNWELMTSFCDTGYMEAYPYLTVKTLKFNYAMNAYF